MRYADLYNAVQTSGKTRISTKWLRQKAIEFSSITIIKEQWSGVVEAAAIRGWYIEGPMEPPVPLTKDQISWEVVAASLSLPVAVIRWMMGDNYERNIKASM